MDVHPAIIDYLRHLRDRAGAVAYENAARQVADHLIGRYDLAELHAALTLNEDEIDDPVADEILSRLVQ